jgi:glycosyltransferase involved in cell wall biosynthesis
VAFSVLILTLNEERNLPSCLASVRGCGDVVVLDSGSADRTVAVAREAGARVFDRPFDNFAGQRNFAQVSIPFRNRWVFHLDADERMTPELAAECAQASGRTDLDGFYAAPRMLLEGTWIPRCTDFPAWQARFVRAPGFRFVQAGHGQREDPAMRMGRLEACYLHEMLSGGEAAWTEKHRRYAAEEAATALTAPLAPRQLFARDPLARRRAVKRVGATLPFRPALRFIYQYFLRLGFLDGGPGLRYCRMLARYEGFVAAEVRRLRRAGG